jgi:hypothetical protein
MVHRDVSYFPYTKVGVDQPLAVSYYSHLLLRFTLMDLPHHASEERDYITMRTLTAVRQYLAAAFLLVIGVIAYGCGDSATVSEPAALGNLSASTGELQPSFNPATTDYTVRLSSDVSSTTITASPRVAGDTIRIDNQQTTSQAITLASPGDEKPITIVVTDTGTGGTSKSYRVTVKRDKEDTSLSALSVSDGTLAPLLFDKNVHDYTVNNVGASVTTAIISVTKSNQNTVMQIDWPSGSVTVPPGAPSGQATVQLGGTGSNTKVSIVVTATGGSPNTYTVTINRGPSNDKFLKSLSIPPGKLDFKVTSFVYNVTVLSNVDNVTVTATPRDPTARITINGSDTNSQSINVPVPGAPPVQITIRVTAQNGESKNYTINVKRDALNGNNVLKSLSISPGKLNFEASDTLYDVNVSNGVEKVTVTATPQVSTASVAILVNGAGTNSQPITLLGPGLTTNIKVRVTAQNGTAKDYDINVKRAALNGNNNLKSLTVLPGNLTFDPDDLTYAVSLPSSETSVKITATPQDGSANVTINGQPSPNTINLGAPGPETQITIPIVVTAQNNDTKRYEVTVIRTALGGNNNLQSLAVSQPGLSPSPFRADRTVYRLNVGNNIDSITVTASPQVTSSSMSMKVNNGVPINLTAGQASPSISLAPEPSDTEIEIIVKAQNQSEKPYVITVTRLAPSGNNNLSDLRVRVGSANQTLTPAFGQSPQNEYTVNVTTDVTEVIVSATKADPSAIISGGLPNEGQATIPLDGAPSTKTILIIVTAPNQTSKTYTLTVNRPAASTKPPTPTVAPDLITADDSCNRNLPTDPCNPGTSQDDNITNVPQPRFRVAPLAPGETPILYVDGDQVKVGFDQGTDTLTPTSPMKDGKDRKVTSTVKNAAGVESLPSDPLLVTIDTKAPGN